MPAHSNRPRTRSQDITIPAFVPLDSMFVLRTALLVNTAWISHFLSEQAVHKTSGDTLTGLETAHIDKRLCPAMCPRQAKPSPVG
jgi:hypothetical protein